MPPQARQLIFLLFSFTVLLFIIHLTPLGLGPLAKFNMDAEVGVPAWFTQTMLFSASMLAAYIGYLKRKKNDPSTAGWLGVAAVLLYLNIDETVAIHELAGEPLRKILAIESGPFIFAWVILAAVAVLVVILVFFRFFLLLPTRTRILLAFAAATYVAGAMGMELLAGYYWSSQNFTFDTVYRILTGIEESLENIGVILTLWALLDTIVSAVQKTATRSRQP